MVRRTTFDKHLRMDFDEGAMAKGAEAMLRGDCTARAANRRSASMELHRQAPVVVRVRNTKPAGPRSARATAEASVSLSETSRVRREAGIRPSEIASVF